jgi:hypothetical protein
MLACRKIKKIITGSLYPVKFRIVKSSRIFFRLLLLSKIIFFNILNKLNCRLRFHKIIRVGLKTLIFSGLIFLIAIGFEPLKIFASIKNLYSDSKTINLYASGCQTEKMSESFESGWWNGQNSAGLPELGSSDELFAFSGGNFNLICKNFSASAKPKDLKEPVAEEINIEAVLDIPSEETISEDRADHAQTENVSNNETAGETTVVEDKFNTGKETNNEEASSSEKAEQNLIENNFPAENVEIATATDESATIKKIIIKKKRGWNYWTKVCCQMS